MDDADFQVVLTTSAWRDFYNQLAWLGQNRSLGHLEAFETNFYKLTDTPSAQPYRWQKENIAGRPLRRAVHDKHWIVLYETYPNEARVVVLSIRGAAEDWKNIPVVD